MTSNRLFQILNGLEGLLTLNLQVYKDFLVSLSCARVTFVPSLILNFDPPEEEGCIPMRDVGVE